MWEDLLEREILEIRVVELEVFTRLEWLRDFSSVFSVVDSVNMNFAPLWPSSRTVFRSCLDREYWRIVERPFYFVLACNFVFEVLNNEVFLQNVCFVLSNYHEGGQNFEIRVFAQL
jgi:hypothetical protein